jgi:hypothetical protein
MEVEHQNGLLVGLLKMGFQHSRCSNLSRYTTRAVAS